MGRHSIGNLGGPGPVRTLAIIGGAITLAGVGILASTGVFSKDASGDPSCAQARVLVPSDIADVVRDRAKSIEGSGGCAAIAVTEGAPTALANDARSGASLPDAWISDSPLWISDASAALKTRNTTTTTGDVFATSPVVIAVPAEIANAANTGVKPWITLLSAVPLGAASPSQETSSALAFTAVWQQLRTNPVGSAAMGDAFFRIVREGHDQATLLAQTGSTAKAFPSTEQEIASHNAAAADEATLHALIPAEGTPSLQYSLNVIGQPTGDTASALNALTSALSEESAKKALLEAGFRVDGDRREAVAEIPDQLPGKTPQLNQQEFAGIIRDWAYVNRDLRLNAVVDVSGSMLAKAGETRRIDLAVTAVQQSVRMMKPSSSGGLWAFSTAQQGKSDYRVVAGVATLGDVNDANSHAAALLRAAAQLPSFVRGDTGLNDTIYAAFRSAQRGYQADRDNLVVVITDGRNDDTTGGLSTGQLISRLKATVDPARPVRIVVVGMGTEADQAIMSEVTSVVNGRAYYVTDPAEIPAAFGSAIWSTNR